MRVTFFLFAICVAALASTVAADSKKKLQIGVKKRVEDCKIRSRKGDFLHMHYTVLTSIGTIHIGSCMLKDRAIETSLDQLM